MKYLAALIALWATGHLSFANAGAAIVGVYLLDRAFGALASLVTSRWLPAPAVERMLAEREAKVAAEWAERLDEATGHLDSAMRRMDILERQRSIAEERVVRLRMEIDLLRHGPSGARGRQRPRKQAGTRPSTWWEILGVDPSAPHPEVEAAYKSLAREHHPDRPGGSLGRMQEINAAMDLYRKLARA